MDYTRLMAEYTANLKYEDLPGEVVEQVKLLTLQTVGVAIASYPIGQAKRAIAMVKDHGGKREATILVDGTKVPMTEAAFVNATMADILDWEDCSWTGHPSAGAIPVGLAVGEATSASGKDFITAVVAGYEVYQRIAMAVQPSDELRKRRQSWGLVSWQIYSAVIPAAKLLKLSVEKVAQALGVTFYQINVPASQHGLPAVGKSDLYHYAHGFNARNGISSSLIAQSGIDSMYNSLDGPSGVWAQLSDRCDWNWYTRKDYLIMETLFKHWPSNVWIQSPLDALDTVVKEHRIKPDQIAGITVSPDNKMMMMYWPEGYAGILDAEFSVPFCFASLLLDPEPGPNWYAEERLRDPKILALASMVKAEEPVVTPAGCFSLFQSGSWPETTIKVTLKDGTQLTSAVAFPKGHPRNRLSVDEFRDRFHRAASFALKTEKIEKAMDTILNLEKVRDMSEVAELLHN